MVTFFSLVLINRWNGPRYRHVLALCVFFNRGDTEGTNSLDDFVFDVCVCIFCLIKICVRTDMVEFREFVVVSADELGDRLKSVFWL